MENDKTANAYRVIYRYDYILYAYIGYYPKGISFYHGGEIKKGLVAQSFSTYTNSGFSSSSMVSLNPENKCWRNSFTVSMITSTMGVSLDIIYSYIGWAGINSGLHSFQ